MSTMIRSVQTIQRRSRSIFAEASHRAWLGEQATVQRYFAFGKKPRLPSSSLSASSCGRIQQQRGAVRRASSKPESAQGGTTKTMWNNEHPFMVDKTTGFMGFSKSELAGNLSFICVCIAYLNTDILMLRMLSMASISLSIVFQFYRAIPLWIPIKWNTLLLSINTFMLAFLVLERTRAESMSRPMEDLYHKGHFGARGFSKVEFLRLFLLAKKVKLEKGDVLARDGEVNTHLYFVIKGKVSVQVQQKTIAVVTPYHLIGEMAFLSYSLDKKSRVTATADVIVEDDETIAYIWSFSKLKKYLGSEREVSNALSAYINHDLREKLAKTMH